MLVQPFITCVAGRAPQWSLPVFLCTMYSLLICGFSDVQLVWTPTCVLYLTCSFMKLSGCPLYTIVNRVFGIQPYEDLNNSITHMLSCVPPYGACVLSVDSLLTRVLSESEPYGVCVVSTDLQNLCCPAGHLLEPACCPSYNLKHVLSGVMELACCFHAICLLLLSIVRSIVSLNGTTCSVG